MTGENRQARDWDDTTPAEGFAYDVPPAATVDRLIGWFKDRACADEGMAIALDSQALPVAADANRRRAKAYRATVMCLEALRERCCQPEPEFRAHLKPAVRPRPQVRAPP